MDKYKDQLPVEMRKLIRKNKFIKHTSGVCNGYVQANVVILPEDYAEDFRQFAEANKEAVPVLEEISNGEFSFKKVADDSDIRTDVPKYKVFKNGEFVETKTSIKELWQDDFVTFLLGCSFSFENAFMQQGVPVRHIEQDRNVPMYITSKPCVSAGRFSGTMVVSMRPIPKDQVEEAVTITKMFPLAHGEPVQIGNPEAIGIQDINQPDFGDAVEIKAGDVPVFWPCGVTPQNAAKNAKPDIMITHSPGHMFITDLKDEDIKNKNI
jgi:uncharacterized protein YcsI (UPF0317 family)